MWSPTHVQVLVKRAKGLKIKGKNGTNDPFVTIGLGKEKFQTSVVEKTSDSVEWMEQCELGIPTKGNTAEIVLTVLHRNFLGVDEFLGRVPLPLSNFDHHEKPRSKWYPLQCKPGQSKTDYRGELEVRIEFKVNSSEAVGGSVADLRSKKKGSLTSLSKLKGNAVGGSLMTLGSKQTGIKKFADSMGHKLDKVGGKAKKSLSSLKLNKDKKNLDSVPEGRELGGLGNLNLDPGVNSDEEEDIDQIFKKVSRSGSSVSLSRKSVDSYQPSPGLSPKKQDRSFTMGSVGSGLGEGNADSLFKFDLNVERGTLKRSNGDIRHDLNGNENEVIVTESESHKKKKKKKNKDKDTERKEKKKSKRNKEENFGNFDREDSMRNERLSEQFLDNDANLDDEDQEIQVDVSLPNNDWDVNVTPPPQPRHNIEISNNWKRREEIIEQPKVSPPITKSSPASKSKLGLDFKEEQRPPPSVQKTKTKVEQLIESDSESEEDIDLEDAEDDEPETPSDEKLPLDVLSKFNGKTREDLIKILVKHQSTIETQGKKITDLESYIDSLLSKVIEVAPVVLQKDIKNVNRPYFNNVFSRRTKFG